MDKKQETIKKWESLLGNISNDKKDWLEQYSDFISNDSEIKSKPNGIIESQPFNDKNVLLPIARRVVAQTIGLDLVSVSPMGGGNTSEEIKKIREDIKSENRDRKINSVIEDKDFEEMKTEDHPDYIKPKGPSGQLFYMDYIYGSTNSNV